MPDFYSPLLTPNADGTSTDEHHLASSVKAGLTRQTTLSQISVPIGTDFADGDFIVVAKLPSNTMLYELWETHTAWISGSTVAIGLRKCNADDSIGAAVSASSHTLFDVSNDLNAGADTPADRFADSFCENYDRGKQLWELINEADATTYTEDPHENWYLVVEVLGGPAISIAVQDLFFEINYYSRG